MTMRDAALEAPSSDRNRNPGEDGIWIFVGGDLSIFALFFVVFLYYRGLDLELFNQSREALSIPLGLLNTLILLTSSWFLASAIEDMREGHFERAPKLLVGSIVLGLGFVLVKYFEYSEKISNGITLVTNDFYMYYYILTGIHLFHLIIGLGVLLFLLKKSRDLSAWGRNSATLFESGAIYWHMVDLLWIFIFPLLYLLR